MSQSLHSIASDKSSIASSVHSDILSQASLDLRAPEGLLEELACVPDKILRSGAVKAMKDLVPVHNSNFDLSEISSIILPTKIEESVLNPTIIQVVK